MPCVLCHYALKIDTYIELRTLPPDIGRMLHSGRRRLWVSHWYIHIPELWWACDRF